MPFCRFRAGLPDGILLFQKYQFWYSLESLGMELDMAIRYILDIIWYIVWQFVKFCGHFGTFFPF
jgi:hypothetical protein